MNHGPTKSMGFTSEEIIIKIIFPEQNFGIQLHILVVQIQQEGTNELFLGFQYNKVKEQDSFFLSLALTFFPSSFLCQIKSNYYIGKFFFSLSLPLSNKAKAKSSSILVV